jgi:hypothetical protein
MSFVSCQLMGGLGNQLFQIFMTMAYAIEHKGAFGFLNQEKLGKRYTAWNTLLQSLKPYLFQSYPTNLIIGKERSFVYTPFPPILHNSICFFGYFQSEKYFKPFYNDIYHILEIDKRKTEVKAKIEECVCPTISMHFRIGDYKPIQAYHPLLTLDYYRRALSHIKSNTEETFFKVIYFCEDSDMEDVINIINPLKVEFPAYEFVRCSSSFADWEQMLYMSLCSHHIIANSTFSWWGAYFNDSTEKIVCYPSVWFGPDASHNDVRDLCPPEWVKIE